MNFSELLIWTLWTGVGLLTLASLALLFTRWGKHRPLHKCVVLSLLAHINLLGYFWTVQIVTHDLQRQHGEEMRVTMLEDPLPADQAPQPQAASSWDQSQTRPAIDPPLDLQRMDQDAESPQLQRSTEFLASALPDFQSVPQPADPVTAAGNAELANPNPLAVDGTPRGAEQVSVPPAQPVAPQPEQTTEIDVAPPDRLVSNDPPPDDPQRNVTLPQSTLPDVVPRMTNQPEAVVTQNLDAPDRDPTLEKFGPEMRPADVDELAHKNPPALNADSSTQARDAQQPEGLAVHPRMAPVQPVGDATNIGPSPLRNASPMAFRNPLPPVYRLRTANNRSEIVAAEGGSALTEASVKSALAWLSRVQAADGRWSAEAHGGGREALVNGENRGGPQMKADAAITGLALLAFLGDGHTHERGEYKEQVGKGLGYLLRIQGGDGNLTGGASTFAAMYCHGMATYALAEAYLLSGDDKLREPLTRAVRYTLEAQSPHDGGWRYKRGDMMGDTSQLGWQLLALTSAEAAGIEIPQSAKDGMVRYLKSVSFGANDGLASYRRAEEASSSMTAEALFCKQLLGMQRDNPACQEAGDYLLGELPGARPRKGRPGDVARPNYYYWYYGTLSMFQLGGEHWDAWNKALLSQLLTRQRGDGDDMGSWDADSEWGAYGGRVYSTALATLSLEAYYRFAPMYQTAQRRGADLMR